MVPQKKQSSGTVPASRASGSGSNNSHGKKGGNGNLPFVLKKSHVRPRTLQGFESNESSEKEILFRVTDFLDSFEGLKQSGSYWYGLTNDLLSNSYGESYQRIHSVHLYALPSFALNTANSAEMVLFGVPVKSGGSDSIRNAAQQATLLVPSSVSEWKRVGTWTADALLSDTTTGLVTSGTGSSATACLFTWAVVNPDTFEPTINAGLQFKVVINVKQSLPLRTGVSGAVVYSEVPNWESPEEPTAIQTLFSGVEALSLGNSQ